MSPTYKNITNQKQELEKRVIMPGEEIYSLSYYNENEIQLLKIGDDPYWNNTILTIKIEKTGEIKIPQKDNLGKNIDKYAIHFYVEKGQVKIFYNNLNNNPPLFLYETSKWNIRCFTRNIDKIVVKGITEKFVLWIIVEKL